MPHSAYNPVKLDEVDNECQDFFASHIKTLYRLGIEQLAQRWFESIEHYMVYFDEYSFYGVMLFIFIFLITNIPLLKMRLGLIMWRIDNGGSAMGDRYWGIGIGGGDRHSHDVTHPRFQ